MARYTTPVVFALLFCLAAALLFLPGSMSDDGSLSETTFDKSALGLRGLELLMQDNGIEVSRPDGHGGEAVLPSTLRILPLRGGKEQVDGESTAETPLEAALSGDRVYDVPTLVILPKWRDAVLRKGVARPSLMVAHSRLVRDLALLGFADLEITRTETTFVEEDAQLISGIRYKTRIFAAQLIDRASIPEHCKEMVGVSAGALMILCGNGVSFYLLSDPDLLNNHGLALGDNAATGLSILTLLLEDSLADRISIDTMGFSLTDPYGENQFRSPSQSLADFARLVTYPFTVIWGVILIVTLLVFWRGALRFGPVVRRENPGLALSKRTVVEAEARLLRLAGNDGQMTAQFVRARLLDKAAHLFGPTARLQSDIERLYAYLAGRDKGLADALRDVATALIERGGAMSGPELHKNLDAFQTLMGRAEFGS